MYQIDFNLGATSLDVAARFGSAESVKMILDYGADVNHKDDMG